uniref:ATPase domain containing protein n=1 Tax=viral metagenome TaxID=1070528 RepID=A0A6H2A2J3_9ZZZZ
MSNGLKVEKKPRTFKLASDEVICIGGMRGTGKTTLAKHITSQFESVYVFDPLNQYAEFEHYVPETSSIEEFDSVAKRIWLKGNMVFVVEECEGYLGERMALSPYAFKIVLQGRNRGIGLIAVTRRIANLSKTVFSLSDHVYLFRFFSPNDVKYCAEFIGRAWGARLQKLPKFHFLYYSTEGEIMECPPIAI